jgi:hypothetical protein
MIVKHADPTASTNQQSQCIQFGKPMSFISSWNAFNYQDIFYYESQESNSSSFPQQIHFVPWLGFKFLTSRVTGTINGSKYPGYIFGTFTPVSFSSTILFRIGGTTKQKDKTVNSGSCEYV